MHRKRRGSSMNVMSDDHIKKQIGLPIVLQRTGHCMGVVGRIILDLEQQIFVDLDQSKIQLTDAKALQSIDFLKQATDDLAALLSRLAHAAPQSLSVDQAALLDPISVQSLREMIGEYDESQTDEGTVFKAQEIELF